MILMNVEACESNNFNSQFSFISKNARNYDKRAKNEATSIASHAAGFYYNTMKKGSARQGTASDIFRAGTSNNSRQVIARKPNQEPSEPTILLWDSGVAAELAPKTGKRSTIRSRKQHAQSRRSPAASGDSTPSPPKAICLSSPDPFETFPCRLGPHAAELTQIWYRYFMNLCLPAGGSHKLEAVASRAWQSRVVDMLQGRMQACAFFAGALAIKARFLAPETAKETWPEVYRLHRDALAALRERLQSESYSEGVLLTMFTVGSVNFYSGDWAENSKHSYAADHIITQMLGGIDALSETTRDHMVEGCLSTSFCLMTRSGLSHQRWITGPWTSHPLSGKRPCVADVQFGNSAWALSDNEKNPLVRLEGYFRAHREFVGVCQIALSLGPDQGEDKDDIFIWLRRRRQTLRVQCLDYWCDLEDSIGSNSWTDRQSNAQADEQTLHERLHQALILGADCFHAMYIHHQKCHAHSLPMWLIYLPIPQLRKALYTVLEAMTTQGGLSHQKALLWLFFVGACAEEIARMMRVTLWPDDLGLSCQEWFVDVSERLCLNSPEQTRKILEKFVYENKFGDVYLKVLLKKRYTV